MHPLFGMAGLAEAADAVARLVGCGGVLLVGLAAAIGFLTRSRFVAATAGLLALLLTCVFTPWAAFLPYESDDPDVHYSVGAWRTFAVYWGIAMAAVLAAVIRAGIRTPPSEPSTTERPTLPESPEPAPREWPAEEPVTFWFRPLTYWFRVVCLLALWCAGLLALSALAALTR